MTVRVASWRRSDRAVERPDDKLLQRTAPRCASRPCRDASHRRQRSPLVGALFGLSYRNWSRGWRRWSVSSIRSIWSIRSVPSIQSGWPISSVPSMPDFRGIGPPGEACPLPRSTSARLRRRGLPQVQIPEDRRASAAPRKAAARDRSRRGIPVQVRPTAPCPSSERRLPHCLRALLEAPRSLC